MTQLPTMKIFGKARTKLHFVEHCVMRLRSRILQPFLHVVSSIKIGFFFHCKYVTNKEQNFLFSVVSRLEIFTSNNSQLILYNSGSTLWELTLKSSESRAVSAAGKQICRKKESQNTPVEIGTSHLWSN